MWHAWLSWKKTANGGYFNRTFFVGVEKDETQIQNKRKSTSKPSFIRSLETATVFLQLVILSLMALEIIILQTALEKQNNCSIYSVKPCEWNITGVCVKTYQTYPLANPRGWHGRSKVFPFHAVWGKNCQNNSLASPLLGLVPSPLENPEFAPGIFILHSLYLILLLIFLSEHETNYSTFTREIEKKIFDRFKRRKQGKGSEMSINWFG